MFIGIRLSNEEELGMLLYSRLSNEEELGMLIDSRLSNEEELGVLIDSRLCNEEIFWICRVQLFISRVHVLVFSHCSAC